MSYNPQIPTQSWIAGSAPGCDLLVDQPSVSRHHCRLICQGTYFWIEDLQSLNGTWINGTRIPPGQPVQVQQHDRITLGQQTPMPWPSSPQVSPAQTSNAAAERPIQAQALDQPPTPSPAPTQVIPVNPAPANPVPANQVLTIGRSPQSDVQVDLDIVSWNHARIVFEAGRAILEDLGSSNGTSIDSVENRIQRAALHPASDVFLGSYKIPASRLLGGQRVEVGEAAFDKVAFHGNTMTIGRDPNSDLPLNFPMISWHHARLTREAGGILVEDLGSRNGTFVGGIRVSGKVLARPGEEIGLGSYRFQLLAGGELAQRKYYGNLTIEAADVVVNSPSGKRLIEPVSMTVFPSELVALMGPAGAGKTTLLKALNGYTRPAEGRVLFNGASLYDFYDRFRQQLGYVPQDDIVHAQLTVGEALYFSARLRTDLTDDEIRARTVKVLDQLRMADKQHTPIGSPERKTLSGGQRKRVNIALELINDTPVLFLDEPTSGLSSYDAESLIELLKELSKQGKTIITTIHQPSLHIYKQFDDLIMVNRDPGAKTGSMVYFGPAYPDSIQFFRGQTVSGSSATTPDLSPEMLLSGLAKKSSSEWVEFYRQSSYSRAFVEARSGKQPAGTTEKTAGGKPHRHFDLTQWIALVRRNAIVKLRDRIQTAILLLQAPLFAALVALVYWPLHAENGFGDLAGKLVGLHFLMVVAAIWFGCNNAARDIVGEWTVYKRERMVTLRLASYVFSKLAVLFVLCVFQCLCMLGIVFLTLHLKGNFGLDLLVLVTLSMVGAGSGLCVSAFARTTESAIALLPIVLLPLIALGGGMRPIYQIDANYRWVTDAIPSRWAFEANLLQETGRDGWKKAANSPAVEYLPDYGDPSQAALNTGRAQAQEACEDPARLDSKQAVPPSPRPLLCGDVAELYIPHYLIAWKDENGTQHTARAFRGESKNVAGKIYKATDFRHPFRECLLVLLGMLAAFVLAVLGILLKRDRDPQ
jgi:ABC-type multidrug transport system ATPase subunit/pSer/pThr/pTyr-binding forkhead associated (FHA) protein